MIPGLTPEAFIESAKAVVATLFVMREQIQADVSKMFWDMGWPGRVFVVLAAAIPVYEFVRRVLIPAPAARRRRAR